MNLDRAQSIINIIEDIDKKKIFDFKKPIHKLKICCIVPSRGDPIKLKESYIIDHTFKSILECKYIKKIFLATVYHLKQ